MAAPALAAALALCCFSPPLASAVALDDLMLPPLVVFGRPRPRPPPLAAAGVELPLACRDARPDCALLGPALWEVGGGACRYPAAERCLRTCGLCWRTLHAASCMSPTGACAPFCSGRMPWAEFLDRAVKRSGLPAAALRSGSGFALAELPGFLCADEADHLVALAERLGFEAEDELPPEMRDVGKVDCESPLCLFDPFVGEVYRRMSELLEIPPWNFESLEFLRYGLGQHYNAHPDTDVEHLLEPQAVGAGLRVLTVFFYLSDVEEGGETRFPEAGLDVVPQKGKIVIWPNVREDIRQPDPRAVHQAMPVRRGVKLAANFWVHPFDGRAPEQFAPSVC